MPASLHSSGLISGLFFQTDLVQVRHMPLVQVSNDGTDSQLGWDQGFICLTLVFTDFQKLDLKQEKSFYYACTLKTFSPSLNDTVTQRLISTGAHRAEEPQLELPCASKEAQIHPWGGLDWLPWDRVESAWGCIFKVIWWFQMTFWLILYGTSTKRGPRQQNPIFYYSHSFPC